MTKLAEYARQAVDLKPSHAPVTWWNARRINRRWGRGMITSYQRPKTAEDVERGLQLIAGIEVPNWKMIQAGIDRQAVPQMVSGGYAGLEGASASGAAQSLPDPIAAVTFVNGDFSPFVATTYCPTPNRAPVTISFYASFTIAGAAAPGTLLVTPGIGTALTAKNLGAGVATATLAAAGTLTLMIDGKLSLRHTGTGSGATAYFTGNMLGRLATAGNGTADVNQTIGFTQGTFDSTALNGLWMTMTGSATTAAITTQQILFGSWN